MALKYPPWGGGTGGRGWTPLGGPPLLPRYTTTAISVLELQLSDKRKPKTGVQTGAKTETAIGYGNRSRSLSAKA